MVVKKIVKNKTPTKKASTRTEKQTIERISSKPTPLRTSIPIKTKNPTCECTPIKTNGLRIILAGIVFAIIAQIIHSISAIFSMGYYLIEEYWPVWSKIVMPGAGAPPASFYCYSAGLNFITGIFFALVFTWFACCLGGKDKLKRGALYGLGVFLIGGLPSMFMLYLIINLPAGLLAIWTLESLIISLIAGAAVAHIIK
ncbi:MAG: hypothetical protein KKB03_00350 [Nanoarchaeota archaeon]|nr:hypothetical protein [Nanoarchaeota archaeon]MBU1135437.1 hypothetical protein [Nanoarchaeota archaeon]MBU2519679.1 hypothetical protein [Nanoarchaeota archaeon]